MQVTPHSGELVDEQAFSFTACENTKLYSYSSRYQAVSYKIINTLWHTSQLSPSLIYPAELKAGVHTKNAKMDIYSSFIHAAKLGSNQDVLPQVSG